MMSQPTKVEEDPTPEKIFSADVLRHIKEVYGEKADEVASALTKPGKYFYLRVNTLKVKTERIIDRLCRAGYEASVHPNLPEAIRIPIRESLPIPNHPMKIKVDKFTAESVLLGADAYAPGILNCKGLKRDQNVTIICDNGIKVGSGIAQMSETEILNLRKGLAVEITHRAYNIPSLRASNEFKDGQIYLQSLPAMVTTRVLDPKPGETIVDLNCSPGGKLTHISQIMGEDGIVFGVDRNQRKLALARATADRLGCKNVRLLVSDGRYLDKDHPEIKADRCLIDPPCSALGVMPKLYDNTIEEEVKALSAYQKQFMKAASRIVKTDGFIVYSVCTLTLEECEEVARFGVEECNLTVEEQPLVLGSPGIESVFYDAVKTQRFHPHIHGNGYFIALFRKE
jgi:16S rRNA C967 or C1407 C5-methylase (RsmB/RsmF family)